MPTAAPVGRKVATTQHYLHRKFGFQVVTPGPSKRLQHPVAAECDSRHHGVRFQAPITGDRSVFPESAGRCWRSSFMTTWQDWQINHRGRAGRAAFFQHPGQFHAGGSIHALRIVWLCGSALPRHLDKIREQSGEQANDARTCRVLDGIAARCLLSRSRPPIWNEQTTRRPFYRLWPVIREPR